MKKLIAIVLAVAICLSVLTVFASAVSVQTLATIKLNTDRQFTYTYNGQKRVYTISSVSILRADNEVAYKVEPDPSLKYSASPTAALSFEQETALRYILSFGAPGGMSNSDAKTEYGYEVATQIAIWEVVMGLRKTTTPYNALDSSLYNLFEKGITDPVILGAFRAGYEQLNKSLRLQSSVPSFASPLESNAKTVVLLQDKNSKYDFSITDNNAIVGQFNFSTKTGITLKPTTNKLLISITPPAPPSDLPKNAVMLLGDADNMCAVLNSDGSIGKIMKKSSSWQEVSADKNSYITFSTNNKQYAIPKSILISAERQYPASKNVLLWVSSSGQHVTGKLNLLSYSQQIFFNLKIDTQFDKFTDVSPSDWFYKAVITAVVNRIFTGTSDTTFSPQKTMTREMLATALYNLSKDTNPSYTKMPFSDTETGKWYSDAVVWASKNNIISGYGNNLFGVGDPVTREQAATVLFRYAQYKGVPLIGANTLTEFSDKSSVHSWALQAIQWAVSNNLMSGQNNNGKIILNPLAKATRAEIATIIVAYIEIFG